MGNNLGDIKDIPFVVETLLLRNSLNFDVPLCSSSVINVIDKVSAGIVWVSSKLLSLFFAQVFDSRSGFEVHLDPKGLTVFVDPSKGM